MNSSNNIRDKNDFETPDSIESKVGDWYTRWQTFQQDKQKRKNDDDEFSSPPISTLGSETLDIIYDSLQWIMSLLDSISAFRNAFGLNAFWRAFRKRLRWFSSRTVDSTAATQQIRSLYDVITTQIIDPLQTLFLKYLDRVHGETYIATEDLFVTRLYRWIRRVWVASILGSWWQRRQQLNLLSRGTASSSSNFSFSLKAFLMMVLIYVWRIGYLRWRMKSADGSLSPMTHYGQMFTEEMPLEEYKNYKRRFYQHRSQQNSEYYYSHGSGYADGNINQRRDFFSYWPSRQRRREYLEFRAPPSNRDSYHHHGSYGANQQDILVGIRRRTQHQEPHHSNPNMRYSTTQGYDAYDNDHF